MDHLFAPRSRVSALHLAPTGRQVAHHVALILGGNGDLHLGHGLQYHWVGLGEGGAERQLAGHVEAEFG